MNRVRLWVARRLLPSGWEAVAYFGSSVVYATHSDGFYTYDGVNGWHKVG